jgi:3-oxoacyl-[acyl-carrier-protein] synthase II
MSTPSERIAVTGLGIVSALGADAPRSFERLLRGERALHSVSLFETGGARSHLAAEVTCELPPADALGASGPLLSRSDRLALLAAAEALKSAGDRAKSARLGLSIGGTTGGMAFAEEELFAKDAGATGIARARRLLSHPLSATAQALEAALGPFTCHSSVCTACSSGAVAIVQAAHWLLRGDVDQALAGGVDALCRMTFAGFDALGALDTEPCRPFDRGRKGLTLGEGASFLVLERESRARARGARVLAWLSGWAIGAEAHHVTHPEPSGQRAAALMRSTLSMAGLTPADLDYVNAHGTGTLANDAMEAKALLQVLGAEAPRVRVSSSKGQLGHTLGAAGALEAAITALALDQQLAPPTAGLTEPDEPALRHVLGRAEPAEMRAALSSSFGFGGMNAVLLLEHVSAPARTGVKLQHSFVVSAATAVGITLDGQRPLEAAEPALDPLTQLDAERSRRFDRGAAWVTLSVGQLLESAQIAGDKVGLAVGNAYGAVERSLAFLDRLRERGLRLSPPAEFPQLVHSALAGNASIYLKLDGPVAGVAEGAMSGPAALSRALAWLELDLAKAVVAGALEARDPVTAELLAGGSGRARGEGGGFLLLEPAAQALERGHTALARLAEHREERGGGEAVWSAPRAEMQALVLQCGEPGLGELVQNSAWGRCRRIDLAAAELTHEALSGSALALGALLVASGTSEVLVVAGNRHVRYVTRFEALEPT